MPVMRQEDEEFGLQVDQSEEESSEEETEDDSEEEDDDDSEEETEDDSEEETEDDSEEESGDETTEDDEDSDDEEDEDSDEDETTDDGDDEDESESDDDDDEEETFEDEEGLVSGEPKVIGEDPAAKRRKVIAGTILCVLLLVLILGLGLGLGLKDDDPDPTPAPTPAPTNAPTTAPPTAAPTMNETDAPTMAEIGGVVMINAAFDTTIYVDGQNQGGDFGTQDTMLVQGGDPGDNDLARAYSLVQFPLNGTEVGMLMEPVESEFCLTHVINEGPADRVVTYSTCAVPFTSDVGNLTGSTATYNLPDDCLNSEIVQFDILPTSSQECINVTQIVASLGSDTGGGNEPARLRGRWRRLQEDGPLLQEQPLFQDSVSLPDGPVVMAIYFSGDSTETGDRFYTSNDADGRGPELNFVSMADTPTMSPTTNSTDENEPCNICGGDLGITIPDGQLPTGDENIVLTCETAQLACEDGLCTPDQCNILAQVTGPICGCEAVNPTDSPEGTDAPAPIYDPCNICEDGLNVTIPDGAIPGSDLTCGVVAQGCLSGFCNATECEAVKQIAAEPCGCSAGDIEV